MLTCIVYFQFNFCKEFIAVLMVVELIWRFVEENDGSIGILSSHRHSERAETELLMKGGGEEGLFFLHFT